MKKLSKVMSFCLAASMLVITGCETSENKVQVNKMIDQLDEAPEVTEKKQKDCKKECRWNSKRV